MQDWRADLTTGDENLLLVFLRGSGLDPYSHPEIDVRDANVGYALAKKGIIDYATHTAKRCFEAAKRRQEELNCAELAQLIQNRIGCLPELRRAILNEIEFEVLARMTAQHSAINADSGSDLRAMS